MGRSEHPFLIKWFVMLFYPDGQERRMYIYEGPLDAAPVAEAWERDDLARARGPFEQYYCSNDGGEQVVVHACDWRICNPDFFRVC